jgi:GxxExxY protein
MERGMDIDFRRVNEVTDKIIGAGFRVHTELGPGLLESAYVACLMYELQDLGLQIHHEKPLPLHYRGRNLECGYRLDLVVEELVIVEIKAVEALARIHEAQIISYLKISGYPYGLLMNFHSLRLKDGLKRFANPPLIKPAT